MQRSYFGSMHVDFNTSHVAVPFYHVLLQGHYYVNFNTSHVAVPFVSNTTLIFPLSYFNTSHVAVPWFTWKIRGEFIQISIHLMWRFHATLILYCLRRFCHFNTSHVAVPYFYIFGKYRFYFYFNTSHVAVPYHIIIGDGRFISNFNTSHVAVPSVGVYYLCAYAKFQYISCGGSICLR